MQYDLIIRNGTIVDGSGLPRYRADIGIVHGRIVTIGKIRARAKETLDAEGHIVSPGFIDVHTHMDAQVNWDPLGTCSSWNGITSVVMGNCGFSLAPCHEKDKHLVMRNLEHAEDLSAEAMEAGIQWSWETFPDYLDTLEHLPKGINYAAYMGHCALRTYVMGERAFVEEATADDLERMKREMRDALRAGAMGFTTSRTYNHQTPDGAPVSSRLATWDEVRQLVGVMGEMNAGIFELAGEDVFNDPDAFQDYSRRLRGLAIDTGVPVTFGTFSRRYAPNDWRPYFAMADETAADGGRMMIQVDSRSMNIMLSFETQMPYDSLPMWCDIRQLSLAEQEAALREPEIRRKLVEIAHQQDDDGGVGVGLSARTANYDYLFVLDQPIPPHRTIADLARGVGKDPVDVVIDLALEKGMKQFFYQPLSNDNQDHVLEMMRHPRSVVTFSDSGAHVSQLAGSSLQSHVLSYWVRQQQELTLEEAVRMISFVPASHWGMTGRGLLREGNIADIVVFDPHRIGPMLPEVVQDLPAGATRLKQKSSGLMATVVHGEVLLRDNEHTGAFPGKVIRGPLGRQGA